MIMLVLKILAILAWIHVLSYVVSTDDVDLLRFTSCVACILGIVGVVL